MIDVQTELKMANFKTMRIPCPCHRQFFIVLSLPLNAAAEVSWDWQTFQSTVALGEWKRMIAQSKEMPTHDDDKTIVQMPFPVR
jgi:hypothetical protein